ncbi:MAG TPA: hypothetical protein VKE93_01870 [Candidatus Angelobacter sp.]|nr:hypothetical protein [Candidatus Angelobacter sp.]
MPRSLRYPVLFLCLFLIFAALPTLAQVAQPTDQSNTQQAQPSALNPVQPLPARPRLHIVPFRDPAEPVIFAAPAGAHLSYFGGPVISNVHVVQVLYGSGSYNAQVAGTSTPSMGNFFGDLTGTNSGYVNLLTQYNTPASGGTNQTIGNGTFDGLFQIVPSAANNGSTIDDSNIQAELLAQINAGHLPAPLLDAAGNVNTIYMIYFPPGKTITQGGSSSCVGGGFCAYHGTTSTTFNSSHLLYGVLPDMQAGSGCSSGCGTSSVFGNYTSVTSHELTEAITDADVGIATTFSPPLAWYDMTNGEIGDICNGQQGSYTANGTTYTIQLEFSNAANNCVLPPAAANPNFTLSASPSSVSVTQGNSGSSTITVTPSGGFTGSVTLSASGLPSGVTASFGTNPTTSTSSVTFTASSTATTGTATVTITGTSGSLTHTTTISLTVNATPTPNFSLSASPSSVSVTQGGSGSSTVTVTPSGGFTGSVTLSASGLPSGVTASFGTNPTTSTSSVTFTASSTATTGTASVTITGTSGSLTHTTTISLTVNAPAQPDFSLSASPASLTVKQGTSGSSTITVAPTGGFTGSVTLSTSALPSGVTASFGTNPTTSTSVLTFTASSTAATGTSNITVTGTSGSLTHTTTISLTISSAAAQQLLGNPGFENGTNTAPWTLTPAVINNSASEPPHSGAWDAWLDGYGTTHTDSATQTVTIPSTATTATLSFWLHIDTAETTTTTAFDTLQVQVLNSSGTVLATLGTFSNLNHAAGYQQHSFSVIQFKGQTVRIRFLGREDSSLQTSFVIDDTALNVQ